MKRIILAATVLILAAAISGCKTKAVSRTFDADMEKTWAAVVAVSEKISKEKPDVDAVNRKVVTGWVYENVRAQAEQGPTIKRSADVWRGIITCKVEGSKTKVTIKLQKGELAARENAGNQDRSGGTGVGVTLWSSDEDAQNRFLAKVEDELAKGKSAVNSEQ